MAIVEKSEKKNPKQWEEFAVLRLSKRELAGLAALMAGDCGDIVPFKLYSDVDDLLGRKNDYNDPNKNNHLAISARLNSIYGEI